MPTMGLVGFFTTAICASFLLGQATPEAQTDARIFGLTVVEWGVLLGAIATFLESLRQRHGRLREKGEKITEADKAQALREAFAETMNEHPEIRTAGRRKAQHKATKMGVSLDVLRALLESRDDDEPIIDTEADTVLEEPAADPEGEKEA